MNKQKISKHLENFSEKKNVNSYEKVFLKLVE